MVDATATTPQVNTKVTLGGSTYELRDMKTQEGLALYNALPTDYQKQADQIAQIITTYASVSKIAQANGLNPTELAQDWARTANNSEAAKAARKAFSEAKQAALKQMDDSGIDLKSLVRMIPIVGEPLVGAANTAKGAGAIAGVVTGSIGAAADGLWNGAPRMWDMIGTLYTEGKGQIFGYGTGAPDDAAKAFAAATMALRYQAVQERHAKPLMDMPFNGKESQVEANPVQYGKTGFSWLMDWLKQNIPFMEYVIGAFEWATNWPEKDKPSFTQYVNQAKADIALAKQKTPANGKHFDKLADEAMYEVEGEGAAKVLEAAKTVAGMKTEGLAKVTTASNTTHRDTAGVDHVRQNGVEVAQVTPTQRVKNAANAIIGDGETHEQVIRGAAAVAGTAAVLNGARGMTEGLARQGITRPEASAVDATKRVNQLNAKIAAAEAPATGKISEFFKPSAEKIEAMKAERDALKEKAVADGQKVALRKAIAVDFVKNAATPLKEINGSKWEAAWNITRGVGRWVGDKTASATVGIYNIASGTLSAAKDFVVGSTKSVHGLVNGAEEAAKTAGFMQGMGKAAGTLGVAGIALAPLSTGVQTLQAIGENKTGSAALHGAETTGLMAMMLKGGIKMGLKRVPYVGPIISGVEGIDAAAHDDKGGMVKAGAELGTIGAGAGIGAGIGVWFFGVGAIPGAAIGATVGGIASIFTGSAAERAYNKKSVAQPKTPVPATDMQASAPRFTPEEQPQFTPEAMAAAHEGVIAQARAATQTGAPRINFNLGLHGSKLAFANVNYNAMGALSSNAASTSGSTATPSRTAQPTTTL
jgi:hypothetical protein